MNYLELTFPDPASNLACDEALVGFCEAANDGAILRVWEPADYFVVVGYSNKIALEVNVAACEARGIPILRRFSGGGAVLQGPGCFNYALVIKNARAGSFGDVAAAFKRVLERHQKMLEGLISTAVQIEGTSDLAVGGQKFSGNAQHRKHLYSVVHGTFLLNFELSLVETCLRMPSRQPSYRQSRSHNDFLTNLVIDPVRLRQSLKEAWGADEDLCEVPDKIIEELVAERYSRSEWNFKF